MSVEMSLQRHFVCKKNVEAWHILDLKSAMENGSLCQVLLNKDFYQYGCNRVHLSSSSYVVNLVMVARIVTQKRQGLAPTSFFSLLPPLVFLWYKEFHGTIQFSISFLRPQYRAQKSLPKKPEAAAVVWVF